MHELPITESILKIILKHAAKNNVQKVVKVRLKIGRLCDLEEEWIQNYFSYLSRGTVAEGATIEVQHVPAVFECPSCGRTYEIDKSCPLLVKCPSCGCEEGNIISGREYMVSEMEVY